MTPRSPAADRFRTCRGLTLPEVMTAAGLGAVLLAGVLAVFLFLGRTGQASSHYSEMEAEVRRALQQFANDARSASAVSWSSDRRLTLFVPAAGGAAIPVTYAHDSDPDSAGFRTFYRSAPGADGAETRAVLARNISSLTFHRYKNPRDGAAGEAANDFETRLVQVSLMSTRGTAASAVASHSAVSARFALRNRRDR